MDIYVDGSYRSKDKTSSWAFCAIEHGKVVFEACGRIHNKEKNESFQVAAEIEAVIQALNYISRVNKPATFYFDFLGLKMWINDLFGGSAWSTNKSYTTHYRNYCLAHRKYIIDFKKVKSHSGNKWNEYVDDLAKNAI